ncbi:hypothetical protein MARI_09290 [Marinobacter sp. JH2]|nr:hypothetical protein MARI_09290 [Marinobacter sp. JH2]
MLSVSLPPIKKLRIWACGRYAMSEFMAFELQSKISAVQGTPGEKRHDRGTSKR